MSKPANPQLPDGQWTINNEEKAKCLTLGRELHAWLLEKAEKEKSFHMKYVAGAFQYVMQLAAEKAKAIGDDFKIMQDVIGMYPDLGNKIDEPFSDPVPDAIPETTEEKKARLRKELELLENGEAAQEAAPAPSENATAPVAPKDPEGPTPAQG